MKKFAVFIMFTLGFLLIFSSLPRDADASPPVCDINGIEDPEPISLNSTVIKPIVTPGFITNESNEVVDGEYSIQCSGIGKASTSQVNHAARINGYSNAHELKSAVLNTKKNISLWDVYYQKKTYRMWLYRKSTNSWVDSYMYIR